MKTATLQILGILVLSTLSGSAQGTAFTYQGRLLTGTEPANGLYEMYFTLFDAATNGTQVGTVVSAAPVAVSNGLFTAQLDFGANASIFNGAARWLEITLSIFGSDMAPTTLTPRQAITAAPYALAARSITEALSSAKLAGVYTNLVTLNNPSNLFVGTFSGNASGLSNIQGNRIVGSVPDAALTRAWKITGNAGILPGQFLGTTDPQPLEVRVNNRTAMTLSEVGSLANVNIGTSNVMSTAVNGQTISGGYQNVINGQWSTIGGGHSNVVAAGISTIAGGINNKIFAGAGCAIGGGIGNEMTAEGATIAGGVMNEIGTGSSYSAIGGGTNNIIATNSFASTVAGGWINSVGAYSPYSSVGGGSDNRIGANAGYSAISGGWENEIGESSPISVIAGGRFNTIGSNSFDSAISGGLLNQIRTNSYSSVISGGRENDIGDGSTWAAIAGGAWNRIGTNSDDAAIGGGQNNAIGNDAFGSTIAGGNDNRIGTGAGVGFIGGGYGNRLLDNSTHGTVPGGLSNEAAKRAFAAGTFAKARHTGAFVWGDSFDAEIVSTNADSVTMRANGGYRLFSHSNEIAGVYLAHGDGSWTAMSDRNAKENFEPVNTRDVLEKVAVLPMSKWNYKSQTSDVRHIGPMAQDFKGAFGVGATDTGITTIDADGVALAAIQGLNQKLQEELARRDAENAELKQRLAVLEKALLNRK